MKWIGLTGGIGSGKSFVACVLKEAGAVVIDADQLAREVVRPGTPGFRDVVAAFGRDILTAEGHLDRRRLGSVVFGDARRRECLEKLLHPRILARVREEAGAAAARGERVVVLDAPLLFETGWHVWMDEIWVVVVSESTQLCRLCARDGIGEAEARQRISLQWPLARKAEQADVCIDNNGERAVTRQRVLALWQEVQARAGDATQKRRPWLDE